MIQNVTVDAHVVHVSTLPGEHHFDGVWSTPVIAVRISSQTRTYSQTRALTCSRELKAVHMFFFFFLKKK